MEGRVPELSRSGERDADGEVGASRVSRLCDVDQRSRLAKFASVNPCYILLQLTLGIALDNVVMLGDGGCDRRWWRPGTPC